MTLPLLFGANVDPLWDPARLRKACNVAGSIRAQSPAAFRGSAAQWTEQLVSTVVEHGMNGFVSWPTEDCDNQIARFAEELVPAVRAAVT